VRGTGTQDVILPAGPAYSDDLTGRLSHRPADPTGNPAAVHVCDLNSCASGSCWDSRLAPVAARVPPVAGEIGGNTCSHGFGGRFMSRPDARTAGHPGRTWNNRDRPSGPWPISAYDGVRRRTTGSRRRTAPGRVTT
jgi:endoglucanase